MNRIIGPLLRLVSPSSSAGRNGKAWRTEDLIKNLEIFSKLNDKQIKKLVRLFMPRHYSKGDRLIKKGDTGLGMFIIASGRVEVFDEQDGVAIPLATLGSGESVGEMSLIDDQPRSASVKVLDDTECLLLTRDSFNRLTKRDPDILWGILPHMAERLRTSNRKLAELSEAARSGGASVGSLAAEPAAGRTGDSPEEKQPSQQAASKAERPEQPEKIKEVEEADSEKPPKLISSFLQLSTASFMFCSSTFLLGAQEFLGLLWGEDSISRRLNKREAVVSSLTTRIEENMGKSSKKVFHAFQELMNSLTSLFE